MLSLTVDKAPSAEEKNVSPSAAKNFVPEWKGHVGFVNTAMAKVSLFPACKTGLCLMCGPPVMLEKACVPALHAMRYDDARSFPSEDQCGQKAFAFRPRGLCLWSVLKYGMLQR